MHRLLRVLPLTAAVGFLSGCKMKSSTVQEAADGTPCSDSSACRTPISKAMTTYLDELGFRDGVPASAQAETQIQDAEAGIAASDAAADGNQSGPGLGLTTAGVVNPLTMTKVRSPQLVRAAAQRLQVTSKMHTLRGVNIKGDHLTLHVEQANSNGKNKMFKGTSTTYYQDGTHASAQVFFKPREFGDKGGWDNPWAEVIATDMHNFVGDDVLGSQRPPTDYLKNIGRSYGNIDGDEIYEAIVIENAAIDGTSIQPYELFFTADGVVNQSVKLKPGAKPVVLPEATRAQMLKAVQNDQILRYVIGDMDGHKNQYLFRTRVDAAGRLTELKVVTLDYGAMGALASGLDRNATKDQRMRMNLDKAAVSDLGFGFKVPMPSTVDPEFIIKLKALSADIGRYELAKGDDRLNNRWRAGVKDRVKAFVAAYQNKLTAPAVKAVDDDRTDDSDRHSRDGADSAPADSSADPARDGKDGRARGR